MELFIFILLIWLEAYTIFLTTYFIIYYFRKKRLPWALLLANLLCLVLFFFLEWLVSNHKLALLGGYSEADDWGAGMANVYTWIINESLLLVAFLVTQCIFWIVWRRKYPRVA